MHLMMPNVAEHACFTLSRLSCDHLLQTYVKRTCQAFVSGSVAVALIAIGTDGRSALPSSRFPLKAQGSVASSEEAKGVMVSEASHQVGRHWLSRWRGGATVVDEGSGSKKAKKLKGSKKSKKAKKEAAPEEPAAPKAAAAAPPMASEPVLLQLAAASAVGAAHNVLEVPAAEMARLGLSAGDRVRTRGKRRTTTVCVVAPVNKLRVGDASKSVARLSPQVTLSHFFCQFFHYLGSNASIMSTHACSSKSRKREKRGASSGFKLRGYAYSGVAL